MRTSGERFDSSGARERCVSNGPKGEPRSGGYPYHRPNSKSLLNEQALHLKFVRMRTSGVEVRLERSERTLRQQRPEGEPRSGDILYHRPI
jgi:hypothetical protein